MKPQKYTMINEIIDKISNNKLKYQSTIILGDNNVGKTYLLKELNSLNKWYFIGCVKKNDIDNIKDKNPEAILIDNIEISLEYKDIFNIDSVLKEKFNNKKLIITTHNLNLIPRLTDFNVIILYKNNYTVCDSNDFKAYEDLRSLLSIKNNTAITINRLMNLKLSECWTEIEDKYLENIKTKELNNSQELILKSIIDNK